MKVEEIIPDVRKQKILNVANHLKRKKKANPKNSKAGTLNDFIDVFGGIAGGGAGGDTGSAGGSII